MNSKAISWLGAVTFMYNAAGQDWGGGCQLKTQKTRSNPHKSLDLEIDFDKVWCL